MESVSAIETKGLMIGYRLKGGKNIIIQDNLDLKLEKGKIVSLVGLNGSGKSTLLRTLCGFQPPLAGSVYIEGKNILDYSQYDFSLHVGVVLTEKTNAGGLTAFEIVALGRYPYTGFFGKLRYVDYKVISEAFNLVGMRGKVNSYFSELSDGEKQKIMIAKALAQQCPIIILDEPTAFLDIRSRIGTMVLLKKFASEIGKSILLSTHDLDLAIRMSDEIWIIDRKMPLICGTPAKLVSDGSFIKYFGEIGRAHV